MREVEVYCDICKSKADKNDTYSVAIKWWSDTYYHSYDVCGNCKREAENNIEAVRPYQRNNGTFLGFLRKMLTNK